MEHTHFENEYRIAGRLRLTDADVEMSNGVGQVYIVEGEKLAGRLGISAGHNHYSEEQQGKPGPGEKIHATHDNPRRCARAADN